MIYLAVYKNSTAGLSPAVFFTYRYLTLIIFIRMVISLFYN